MVVLMSKGLLRLCVAGLLVAGLILPVAAAGAQTSGISFDCDKAFPGIFPTFFPDPTAGLPNKPMRNGFVVGPGQYGPGVNHYLLPQMANGGVDPLGRTVFNGSGMAGPIFIWVDAAWTAGANVTLPDIPPITAAARQANGLLAANTFCGASGPDLVRGGSATDVIHGLGGGDKLNGRGGNDFVYGGSDDDTVRGGGDRDFVAGDDGDDRVFGNGGIDLLAGGPGADLLKGGGNGDFLLGEGPWYGEPAPMFLTAPYAGRVPPYPSGYRADGVLGYWSDLSPVRGALAPLPGPPMPGGDPDQYPGGDDVLIGGPGDDLMIGGPGTDLFKAGAGSDAMVGFLDKGVVLNGAGSQARALPAGYWTPVFPYSGEDVSTEYDTGMNTTSDGLADTFDGGDTFRCGVEVVNVDKDNVDGGYGNDTSQNNCERSNAEIQLA
jgi:hypothetical protein